MAAVFLKTRNAYLRKLFQTREQHSVLINETSSHKLGEDLKRPTGSTSTRNLTLSNFRPFRSEINGALHRSTLEPRRPPAKLFRNDVSLSLSLDRINRRHPLE